MGKFYAVKAGRETGIYTNWSDCEKQINGFSGAIYKSFGTRHEAEIFLEKDTEMKKNIKKNDLLVYVDGSYSKPNKRVGFGCVFVQNDKIINSVSQQVQINEEDNLWNVSAEIQGVLYALEWSVKNNYKKINIFYDYEGLENWYSGAWHANKNTTKNYVNELKKYGKLIDINFWKVKAHSGDYYNEQADKLAKDALGNMQNLKENPKNNNIKDSEIVYLDANTFYEIVGNLDDNKTRIIFGKIILNDNAILKIAKYFWKLENYKIKDLEYTAIFDYRTYILEINFTNKATDKRLIKQIEIEGE